MIRIVVKSKKILYLTICVIFQNIDTICSNEIIINKNNIEYKALMSIIEGD